MKTNYEQEPVGWWQDARGVNQPPGSHRDPSLQVKADGTNAGLSATPPAAGGLRGRFAAMAEARRAGKRSH